MPDESVTQWLDRLQAGEDEAARPLWHRYFDRLVRLARKRLAGLPGRMADEEDVALSAFGSFCRDAQDGRFPELTGRDALWRLLLTITTQKALDLRRREHAAKRGGRMERREGDELLERVAGREPSPDFAAQVAEEFQRLHALLGDPELQAVMVAKMEGLTNPEIAERLGCVPRTVERRLRVIRSLWSREVPDE